MDKHDIERIVSAGLPGAEVLVEGDDGAHFKARIVSDAFTNKRTLERHRMVYATLGDAVGREVHALSLETLTPAEAGNVTTKD